MKEKIKETLNKILNSRLLIVFIGIMLFIKTIYFYKNTISISLSENIQKQTLIGTISFITTIVCFLMILPNKLRIRIGLTVSFLISLLLWADNVYYTYSSSVLSVEQLTNLQYTEQIIDAVPSLIKLSQILYFVDFIIIGILYLSKILKTDKEKKYTNKQKLANLVIAIVGVIVFCLIGYDYVEKGTEKMWNKDEQITDTTIYGYHISDILNSFNYSKRAVYSETSEMMIDYNILKKEYEDKYGEIQYDFQGILENKNVLIVQLESVQELVAHKTINGKEITPNLNKFLDENIEFTNMHMQSYSSTADSEYTMVTSTYPMENGMSYSKYFLNKYDNIFEMFNNKNYYTSYMHGNVGTFWNRENVYSRMNIDEISFIDKFEDQSEMIAGFLADELLYKQGVQKIKEQETPFMNFIVAASSHTAFDMPGMINREEKVTIDVGKYKDTFFGNYLEAMNYADYAFGILIDELKKEGLYEDTAILVFGDHNGLSMYDEELQEFLKENNPDLTDIDLKLNYTRVLAGMKIPGVQENMKIDKVMNKLDLKPTFAFLCNLEDGFSLGTNIFASKDFVCLNNARIIAQDYYFDEEWYVIKTGEKVDFDNISEEERLKLEYYYECMEKELDISFSVNINDLLRQ